MSSMALARPAFIKVSGITTDIAHKAESETILGRVYRTIQPHRSQVGWTPEVTPALWAVGEFVDPTANASQPPPPPGEIHAKESWLISDIIIRFKTTTPNFPRN